MTFNGIEELWKFAESTNKKLICYLSKNDKPATRWIKLNKIITGDIVIIDDIVGIVKEDGSLDELGYTQMWVEIDKKHLKLSRDKKLKKLGL